MSTRQPEPEEHVPQLEPAWVENVLEQEGYGHLTEDIPEEGRYAVEMPEEEDILILKDLEGGNGSIRYPSIDELAKDLEGYVKGRYDNFELPDGDHCIYDRSGPAYVQSDKSVDLEDAV